MGTDVRVGDTFHWTTLKWNKVVSVPGGIPLLQAKQRCDLNAVKKFEDTSPKIEGRCLWAVTLDSEVLWGHGIKQSSLQLGWNFLHSALKVKGFPLTLWFPLTPCKCLTVQIFKYTVEDRWPLPPSSEVFGDETKWFFPSDPYICPGVMNPTPPFIRGYTSLLAAMDYLQNYLRPRAKNILEQEWFKPLYH